MVMEQETWITETISSMPGIKVVKLATNKMSGSQRLPAIGQFNITGSLWKNLGPILLIISQDDHSLS
jgi:hypothetical protein